jgi:hypothetical protein
MKICNTCFIKRCKLKIYYVQLVFIEIHLKRLEMFLILHV